eukprot:7083718-Pyramimonas_sp.AAC.1
MGWWGYAKRQELTAYPFPPPPIPVAILARLLLGCPASSAMPCALRVDTFAAASPMASESDVANRLVGLIERRV